jgi:hypothetical protein
LLLAPVTVLPPSGAHAHGGGSRAHAAKPVRAKGGDFSLVSAARPVSLRDFRGKVVALYFGYSSCADLCPMSLASLAEALAKLTPEDAAQIQGRGHFDAEVRQMATHTPHSKRGSPARSEIVAKSWLQVSVADCRGLGLQNASRSACGDWPHCVSDPSR